MPEIRYRLDDLGWFQFEWLVQSLLKARIALGIESWGGAHSDHGRDAYFDGPLAFPTDEPQDGAFLFQAKFVASANAAGAKPFPAVSQAVRKEAMRIKKRIADGEWEDIKHYTLITNAPLSVDDRAGTASVIREVLGHTGITIWSGNDVCDVLDHQPELRRSFPQLLSLRDLNALLAEAVNKEVIERSRSALAASVDYVSTFVPTAAYDRAWTVLREHNFAVLHGPAEMGKTAIAWMVAISQLSTGWEAVVCHSPDDFFKSVEQDRRQIFVADDAFGRTEYDPSAVNRWEKDLHYVLQRVDSKHWLVWTSRKHLLERARQSMDLQGSAGKFPNPGAVLVDASKLSVTERALILYRHAKHSVASEAGRAVVRSHALRIVQNPNFTPERIKGFVAERLPALIDHSGALTVQPGRIELEVTEAINNPTKRMRMSFKALGRQQKYLLLAMLEAGDWPQIPDVQRNYESYPAAQQGTGFAEVLDQLNEAFAKVTGNRYILWIHPSYRDLVIDELYTDSDLRKQFLKRATRGGIALAISRLGGPKGERQLPLLIDDDDWRVVEGRALELVSEGAPSEIADLLTSLTFSAQSHASAVERERLVALIGTVCHATRERWNASRQIFDAVELKAYADASVLLARLPELPDLTCSWDLHSERALGVGAEALKPDVDAIEAWIDFVIEIERTEPRFLVKSRFPAGYVDQIDRLLDAAKSELAEPFEAALPSDYREEATRVHSLGRSLGLLADFLGDDASRAKDIADRLEAKSHNLEETAKELDDDEDDNDQSDGLDSRKAELDVRNIFIDL
jgi:hypothetical protein